MKTMMISEVNVITRVIFELVYNETAVLHVNECTSITVI